MHSTRRLNTPGIKSSSYYKEFQCTVARQQLTTKDGINWRYVDHGGGKLRDMPPLICVHGTSGTEEVFYHQVMSLAEKGYRVMSVRIPVVWTLDAFSSSFDAFLEVLNLDQVHLYGISLGGLLLQNYTSLYPKRVVSLALTNSFCDTSSFTASKNKIWLGLYPILPEFYLKRIILQGFPDYELEVSQAEAVDFMVDCLESLSHEELSSRLSLNGIKVQGGEIRVRLPPESITIIDCQDDVSLPPILRHQLYQKYKGSKKAWLKHGGDFPILSQPDEINIYLMLHLKSNGLYPRNADGSVKMKSSRSSKGRRSMLLGGRGGGICDADDDSDEEEVLLMADGEHDDNARGGKAMEEHQGGEGGEGEDEVVVIPSNESFI